MKYRNMTPEQREAKKAYLKEYLKKYRPAHGDEYLARKKARGREYFREYRRKHNAEDLNNAGVPKCKVRNRSNSILNKTHTKLPGYEIHHCFGYEDPNRFIYIPKTLHLQIHQLLRDNNIPADSNHWNVIRDLVNSYEGYTYIRT